MYKDTSCFLNKKKTKKILFAGRHVPSLVLPIAEIPYTVNGKKVELAVKKILAGQQVTLMATGRIFLPTLAYFSATVGVLRFYL